MRTGVVSAIVAVLSIAVVPTSSDATVHPPDRPDIPVVQPISWTACPADPAVDPELIDAAAQCGSLTVPLDYDRPRAGTIDVALTRVPATNPDQRIGTVFINPGGPGGSGTEFVRYGFGSYLGELLGGRYDVVGFDPRGVGGTAPIRCFVDNDAAAAFLNSQPVFPYQRDQYRPFYDSWWDYGRRWSASGQRIVAHMSTADVARDLDRLRAAVGDRRLTYLGFSYGSYIGTTYANLFGRNVGRVVIDGVLDPRLFASGRQIDSDRVSTQQVLDEIWRLCDEAGDGCPFHTPEGSASRWERLAKALREQPVDLGDGFLYSYDMLIGDALSTLYVPEVWAGDGGAAALLDQLADLVLAEGAADRSAALEARRAVLARLGGSGGSTAAGAEPYLFNGLDAFYGNHCADVEYPKSYQQWRAGDRFAAAGSRFGPAWWWGVAGCAAWPVNQDRYTGPWSTRTANPVLVVGNRFDPATDYAGAQASARLLRNSRLLTYDGWGHTAFGRSACVTDAVVGYLVDGALPAPGTRCGANPNPFLQSSARLAAPPADPQIGLLPTWPVLAGAR
jgi:pimeloyl-ACP methyl ester carboxylesterase